MSRETNPKASEIDDVTMPNYESRGTLGRQTRRSGPPKLLDTPSSERFIIIGNVYVRFSSDSER